MYVDWDYYKIFYYVAKYQNFTKAARVLGSNQPNITHTMNKLEDQLHCVLFIRSNRGVTLTPEGENLYARISSAAVQIQDAEEELSASASLSHGAISISATETALNIYLSEQLRGFHAQYPGIRLRITNHSTLQAVQAVKNGEVDFAVVTTPAETGSDLKRVALMPFNEILVGGPSFAELAGRTLALQELTAYPLIMLENGSMSRIFYRQFFLEHNAELKPDIEAGTTDQMLTLVRSDLGLAFVPEPMARGNLHRKRILQMNLQVPLGLSGLRPPPPAEYRRAGVPPPAVGISEKQAKVNKKPAAPASLCTRYRRGWLSLFFGGNRVRNATRSAGFPGLQGVR